MAGEIRGRSLGASSLGLAFLSGPPADYGCAASPEQKPHPRAHWLVALSLALLLVLLIPGLVFAHAEPVQSQPAPDATVAQAPPAVQIFFSEDLEPRLCHGEVYNAQKQLVSGGPAVVASENPRNLTIPLKPGLPDGTDTVVWQVVSADDGHSTAGVFAFGVGEAARPPVISPVQLGASSGEEATPFGVVGRFLIYLAVALVLGTAAFVLLIGRGDLPLGGLIRLLLIALGLLAVGQVLRLLDETTLAASAPLPGASSSGGLEQVLFGSRFGALWLVRAGAVGAGLILALEGQFAAARRARWLWVGWLVLGVGLVTDLVASSHAAAGNLLAYARLIQSTITWGTTSSLYLPAAAALAWLAKPLNLVVDWLHLTAIGVWIGGLLALAWVAGSECWEPRATETRRRGEAGADGLRASASPSPDLGRLSSNRQSALSPAIGLLVQRFSRVATVGMIVVLLTGLYNTWLYLAGPSSYVASGYGQSLLLKHLAFLALLATAGINHFVTVPLLAEGNAPAYLPARLAGFLAARPSLGIRVEGGLALVVLLSAGLLTSLGPARQPQQILIDPARELPLGTEPFEAILPLSPGGQARLVLNPGRVGPNTYLVEVAASGKPATDVQRVYLELTPLVLESDAPTSATDVATLTPAGNGRFVGHGLEPSAEGLWRADVRIYFLDGSIGTTSATFQSTTRWAAAADPSALQLLAQSARAMAQLRSARIVESLGNGAGAIVVDDYAFAAPDRQEVDAPGGETEIEIGPTMYARFQGSEAWQVGPSAGVRWPDVTYDYLEHGVGAIDVGRRTILGVDCTVVAFYSPPLSGIYEEWIGTRDHLIHQEVMSAPSHYMVNLYYAFDRPVQITPPVLASP